MRLDDGFGRAPTALADKVFTVKCDAQNNPPAEVNLGNFKVEFNTTRDLNSLSI